MNLNYISLELEYDMYAKLDNDYRYQFQSHTRYISNYFSKIIRKKRYKTDSTFNMISIDLVESELRDLNPPMIVPFDVLKVEIPFDKKRYEKIKGSKDCSYYLELLEQGFMKASEFKPIPLDILLDIIENFKDNGCKNIWLHKKKRFKDVDLEIVLTCEFTTNYFQLIVTINQISTKKELVKGVILRTEPDEVVFEGMFKDIKVDKEIIITDSTDSTIVIINKENVFKGYLSYVIIGDEEIKNMLSYQL